MSKDNYYVYPVLSEKNNSYSEECYFVVNSNKQEVKDEKVIIKYDWELKSNLLQKLVNEKKAKMWIVVNTSYTSTTNEVDESDAVIRIEQDELMDLDSIRIHLEIIAAENLTISNNGEFSERYGDEFEFDVNKGDILAESDEFKMITRRGNGNLFVFEKSDKMDGNGIEFNFKEEVIKIRIGENQLAALETIKNNQGKEYYKVCIRMILQQAIASSLILLSESGDEYNESRWKEEYDYIIQEYYDQSIDEKIENSSDEKEKLFEVAQVLLKNLVNDQMSIEDIIINYSKEVK